ncbi:thiolase family protein [Fluviispira sanaruensis]|uniref:Acetyl-CoA C-acetyltransferase n=1 Tax=Fluviispira sanaruensis TaxID=2493639 RepID=A0A4P2VTY4_FLUSA|nr:thiolase family protein [Fluviispira sanaruensis]BBH52885.1 acetyl-CoA C-acetyltransferase [Fluviispira sanaruensis]
MKNVYIVSAKRTPVGRFQGVFKTVSAARLGANAIQAAIEASGVSNTHIDEIIMGEVLTAGVGQAPARQAAIYAGLPDSVQALTIGKVCGSGLKSVVLGAQSILVGDSHLVIAGGQESMSNAPYLLPNARDGLRMGNKEIIDSMIQDGLWDPYNNLHMGNCAEICAKDYKITREEQDAFALESYNRARRAMDQGLFQNEIAPVSVVSSKVTTEVTEDEEPKAADLAKMKSLKPAFEKDGTITAANASKINDGAAALILASEEAVKKYNLKPLAKIINWAGHAQDPKWFTTAPIAAIQKVLIKAKLSSQDIDLYEINEAFALVAMAAMRKLEIPHEKVNPNGGACAIGHPIGASGARILTTLTHSLIQQKKKYGLATLCIGGGEGIAMIIERV